MRVHGTAVLLVVVATSAVSAGCSGHADPIGPRDAAGNWAGSTSQDKGMLFTVTSAGVSDATFTYVLQGSRCGYTSMLQIPAAQAMPINGGRFVMERTQAGAALFISATGQFASSTRATGTLLVQDGQCGDTLSVTWSATKQ